MNAPSDLLTHASSDTETAVSRRLRRIPEVPLPALRLIRPSAAARRWARVVFWLLIVLPFALMLVPYQQNIDGIGRVVDFDPTLRPQLIQSQVNGRIEEDGWKVKEGDRVKKGDLLVKIIDNDPNYLDRLKIQQQAIESKLAAYEGQVKSYQDRLGVLNLVREQTRELAGLRLDIARQQLAQSLQNEQAAVADLSRDQQQFERQKDLFKKGISSERDFEIAENSYQVSTNKRETARLSVLAAKKFVTQQEVDQQRQVSDVEASINTSQANLESSKAEVQATHSELAKIKTDLARQIQDVTAPCDGTVLRIRANQQTTGQVKAGDALMELVPDMKTPAVELFVDGNDVPLILDRIRAQTVERGPAQVPSALRNWPFSYFSRLGETSDSSDCSRVRLQFEGWPAIQVVAWPAVAVGTFGGVVDVVDSTDNGSGKFRILVLPDGKQEWPKDHWLRQGTRVKGWVMLEQVPLGWELWRRLNGFPPVITDKSPEETVKIKRPK